MAANDAPDARVIAFNESKEEVCTLKSGFRQQEMWYATRPITLVQLQL